MFNMLVIEYKVVSYEYFMDEMREWEKYMLLESCDLSKKNEWMWFRYNTWATLQAGGCFRVNLSPEKWWPLKWDPKVKDHIDELEMVKREMEISEKIAENMFKKEG